MAYQTKRPRKTAAPPSKKATTHSVEDTAISMSDGYSNPLARLGMDQPNVMAASRYTVENITQDRELLKALYRGSWLAKKIVDIPAEDMTKNWYKLISQINPACVDQLKALETRHGIKDEMTTGLKWARLFGGAGALMVLKGQEDILDQPLDMSLIMPGDFRGLIVVDRWNLQPCGDLVADMDDLDFGLPEYYQINVDAWKSSYVRVHHSRILRFMGRRLPAEDEVNEEYWGASEFEHIFEELNKRNATSANIAQLIFQANLRVWKNEDLGEFMGAASKEQISRLFRAAQHQNRMANSSGLQMIGSKDSFETHQYTFSGISDIYETFMLDMSGASDIPATKLFGRAPQGMNSTGESDQENYDESLGKNQENQLRPALERLLPVMSMSLWGAVPDDISIGFEPVRPINAKDRADIGQKNTQTIQGAFTAGVVSQKIALQELREAGRPLGMWTHITDEDIEMANASLEPAGEGMPGMPMGLPSAYGAERREPGNPNPTISGCFAADGEFREEEHPRNEKGEFTSAGSSSGSGVPSKYAKEKLKKLPPDIGAKMRDIYEKAASNEQIITSEIEGIAESSGMELSGLENRLKDPDSYLRKIQTDAHDLGVNEEEVAENMYDINRYTGIANSDTIAHKAIKALDDLEKKGYNITGVKNAWLDSGVAYKGINVKAISPEGQKFELQFHTPQSLKLKDLTHPYYEKQRVLPRNDPRWQTYEKEMLQIASQLTPPKDISLVKRRR